MCRWPSSACSRHKCRCCRFSEALHHRWQDEQGEPWTIHSNHGGGHEREEYHE